MAKRKEEKELDFFTLPEGWEVVNARKLDWGTFFTLKMPGLSLYDLRVVPAGKDYPAFIGMPQEKGSDGNWYDQYKLFLSDEDADAIIEAVDQALADAKAPRKARR